MKYLFFSLLVSSTSFAATITEDFSTSQHFDEITSTGVWNLATKRLHVPLVVDRDETDALEQEDEVFSIGTGKDGVFDGTGEATLTGGRVYEFTTFTLPVGITLRCTGTEALEIRVQGDVVIGGTIDLRGGDAAASSGGAASSCGGGAGGNGGTTSLGFSGASATGTVGGGGGRGLAVSHSGGGAGYDGDGSPGGPGGGGGATGAGYGDVLITNLYGGSGGGGGATSSTTVPGGGGGGGGGALKLSSGANVTVTALGRILAQGGAGATTAGGDGGGGSGGALYLQMRDAFTHLGVTDARGGDGGVDGGNAASGRVRYIQNDAAFVPGGTFTVGPNMLTIGKPAYAKLIPYIIESKAYDSGVRFPAYSSFIPQAVFNGGTITYEIAGSSDNFQTDTTGFLAVTSLESLRGKRYFKYRVTLQSASTSNSPEVLGLTLNMDEKFKKEFEFRGAACNSVHGSTASKEATAYTLLFFLYLLALPLALRRKTGKSRNRLRFQ